MKHLAFITLLILMSPFLHAQDSGSANRNIWLLIQDKKGRTMDRVAVQTFNDSVLLMLPKYGEAMLLVKKMDSIVVTIRSGSSFSYINNLGKNVVVKKQGTASASGSLSDVPALLKQRSYRSLTDLLQGNVPGLNITSSGANLRGNNSFMLDTEPLVVLDGVAIGTIDQANRAVNINDIKSIDVIKDGAGWGVRGANGVILIKTKGAR